MSTPPPKPLPPPKQDDELKEFLLVFRQGMLLVVRWIEKRYEVGDADPKKEKRAA